MLTPIVTVGCGTSMLTINLNTGVINGSVTFSGLTSEWGGRPPRVGQGRS